MFYKGTKIKIEKLGVANGWELDLLGLSLSLHCFLFSRGGKLAGLVADL